MKLLLRMAGGLALGFLTYPAGGADLGLGAVEADIQNALVHMDQALSQFITNQLDMESAKQQLEGSVMGETERSGLRDRISMDGERVAGYRAEMISDISYLHDRWGSLKPGERDDVKKAEEALN